jgi:plastocyanin
MKRYATLGALATGLLLAALGCANWSAGGGTSAAGGGSAQIIKVVMTDLGATPRIVTITTPGEYVFVLTNRGLSQHSVEIAGTEVLAAERILPAATTSVELTVDRPGRYRLSSADLSRSGERSCARSRSAT